jgi:hypothetical protein
MKGIKMSIKGEATFGKGEKFFRNFKGVKKMRQWCKKGE